MLASRWAGAPAERAIRSASAASITSGCSSIGRCPTPAKPHEGGAGQLGRDDLAVPEGDHASASPAATSTSQPASAGRAAMPVVGAEGVDEVGERVHGVRADHGVDEVDERGVDAAVAVGEPPGERPDQVAPRPPGTLDERRLRARASSPTPRVKRVAARQQRAGQPAARRPRPPTSRGTRRPTTRSVKNSGCCSASAMIVMPPIECPTSTSGPSGASARMHGVEVVAELVDRAALPRGALGAAVAALVVEHLTDDRVGEVGQEPALEVPGAPVEREPVHEHDGEIGGHTRRGLDLLAGEPHAVVGRHRRGLAGGQRPGVVGPGRQLGGQRVPVGGDRGDAVGRRR